jgi:hypothetical protein
MYRRAIYILSVQLLLFFMASLTKPVTNYRIKKVVSMKRFWDTTALTYDSKGRIIEWSQLALKENYNYLPDKILKTIDEDKTRLTTHYLNKQGAVDSTIVTISDTTVLCIQYKYDANGYLITTSTGCANAREFEVKKYIKNSNIVKQVSYSNGKEYETNYYEYYTELVNRPTLMDIGLYGSGCWGQNSKNLLKTMVVLHNNRDTININKHDYIFDKKGRVIYDIILDKTETADTLQYFY